MAFDTPRRYVPATLPPTDNEECSSCGESEAQLLSVILRENMTGALYGGPKKLSVQVYARVDGPSQPPPHRHSHHYHRQKVRQNQALERHKTR